MSHQAVHPPLGLPAAGPAGEAIGLLLFVGACLAGAVLLSKAAASHAAPMLWYLAVSMGGAAILLFGVVASAGQPPARLRPVLAYGIAAGALMALGSALGYLSVHAVGASFVALAMAFPTLLTYLLSLALRLERPATERLCGVLLGLAGGIALAVGKGIEIGSAAGLSVLLACLMPAVLAGGNVYRSLFWPAGASPLLLAAAMLACGAVLTIPFALMREGLAVVSLATDPALRTLTAVAILAFSVQYVAFFRLQRIAGPVYLSQIGSVAALFGSAAAVLLFGETLPAGALPAGLLIVVGIVLFQRAGRR
jgi:drug/metabolite transporter (DMT)-like permease